MLGPDALIGDTGSSAEVGGQSPFEESKNPSDQELIAPKPFDPEQPPTDEDILDGMVELFLEMGIEIDKDGHIDESEALANLAEANPEASELILNQGKIIPEKTDTRVAPEDIEPDAVAPAEGAAEKLDPKDDNEAAAQNGPAATRSSQNPTDAEQSVETPEPQASKLSDEALRIGIPKIAEFLQIPIANIDISALEATIGPLTDEALKTIKAEDILFEEYAKNLEEILKAKEANPGDAKTKVDTIRAQRDKTIQDIGLKETYDYTTEEAQSRLAKLAEIDPTKKEVYNSLAEKLKSGANPEEAMGKMQELENQFIAQKAERIRGILAEKLGVPVDQVDPDLAYAFSKTLLSENPNNLSLDQLAEQTGKSINAVEAEFVLDFYSNLVQQATLSSETARLIEEGVSPEIAREKAQKTAEIAKNKFITNTPLYKDKVMDQKVEDFISQFASTMGTTISNELARAMSNFGNFKMIDIIKLILDNFY